MAKAKADGIEDCRKRELAVSEKVVGTGVKSNDKESARRQ